MTDTWLCSCYCPDLNDLVTSEPAQVLSYWNDNHHRCLTPQYKWYLCIRHVATREKLRALICAECRMTLAYRADVGKLISMNLERRAA